MDKLKPCPLCMSDSIAVDDDEHSDIILIMTEYRTQIECRECGATITRYSDESMESAHRAAVEAWNRRAHGGTAYMEGECEEDSKGICDKNEHSCWIHDINNLYGCALCGNRETMSHKKKKNYCPSCGAKMDLEGN